MNAASVQLAFDALREHCEINGAGEASMVNIPDPTWSAFLYAAGSETKVQRDGYYWPNYQIENHSGEGTQYGDAQPGGSEWQMTDEESQSSSVSICAFIGVDLWELFQASTSVSYEMDQSFTHSTTETIPNGCDTDQTGTLYWYPLYTLYNGGFYPDGPFGIEILVPVEEGDGSPAGKFDVQCSDG